MNIVHFREALWYNEFMNLGKPLWLDKNIAEFKRHRKARFTQDNFMENVEFEGYSETIIVRPTEPESEITSMYWIWLPAM